MWTMAASLAVGGGSAVSAQCTDVFFNNINININIFDNIILNKKAAFCYNSELKSHLFTPQSHKTTTVSSSLPQVLDIDPGKGFYLQSGGDLLISLIGMHA